MWRPLLALALLTAAAGCQSTHEQMVQQGYPPPYADGYRDGCGSGREAAGSAGTFQKDVPRYLGEKAYATGWDDGFRQCQAMLETHDRQDYMDRHYDEREQRWEHQRDVDRARAFHP